MAGPRPLRTPGEPAKRKRRTAPQTEPPGDPTQHGSLIAPPQFRERSLGEQEQEEQRRLRTPIFLAMIEMRCEFATTRRRSSDSSWPVYSFWSPCIYGKEEPDGDCLGCIHHQAVFVGSNELPRDNTNRHHHHGTRFPIPDEDAADQLVDYLLAHDMRPMQRPQREAYYEAQKHQEAEYASANAERARAEARRAGPAGASALHHEPPATPPQQQQGD